jgi:hypothetical protein
LIALLTYELLHYSFQVYVQVKTNQIVQEEIQKLQENVCRIPELKNEGHNETNKEKPCMLKENWGFLKENRWYLSETIKKSFIKISCQYQEVNRKNDFFLENGPLVELNEGDQIKTEVFEVFCSGHNNYSNKMTQFNMLFAQVVDKLPDKKETPNLHKPDKHGCTPMNVMLLSYDSVSRVSWTIRQKKSLKYMLDEMNFQILNGYNIIGDGTPAGWSFQSKCIHFENKKTNILFCSINSDLYR